MHPGVAQHEFEVWYYNIVCTKWPGVGTGRHRGMRTHMSNRKGYLYTGKDIYKPEGIFINRKGDL